MNELPEPESGKDELLSRLQLLETVVGKLPSQLRLELFERHSQSFLTFLGHSNSTLRHISSRCLAETAKYNLTEVLNLSLPWCLHRVSDLTIPYTRAGIVEIMYHLAKKLDAGLVGVICLLAPSILGRMSDPEPPIRTLASRTFALLVKLMPLESGENGLENLDPDLESQRKKNLDFLTLLTDPSRLSQLSLPLELSNVELRSYQKEGVTWLWFLNQYHLHGILCDDMGLGKTLQTLCVIATSHFYRRQHTTQDPNSIRRSLIVCPRTLVFHWTAEISRFFSDESAEGLLVPEIIERDHDLLKIKPEVTVLITSYETMRKLGSQFEKFPLHYCVLDEGHLIKNPKTQLFSVVSKLKSDHRLILSGTPVQNSVLELWALFEFLMPGYLGTLRSFNALYTKPILGSRDVSVSSKESDAGQKALESLHKHILPFILRRQKADVLHDLPPKLIQDRYCELSAVQVALYGDFSQAKSSEEGEKELVVRKNAFQILAYLRKLCDHPSLVLSPLHVKYNEVCMKLKERQKLTDVDLSGKMRGLKELLHECGIGRSAEAEDVGERSVLGRFSPVVSQHRALVFCQFKATVNLIAAYLSEGSLGAKVSWLRLDGTVPPSERQTVAQKFNSDPSIDLLLLTTQIGGLGLNLTGADVVIFVDHDWNPARDLQAMDRAHRLGQKRTVNVYRLITRGTLEEKMMRYQKFKTHTAETLIGEENRSLLSMATHQLLDLLSLDTDGQPPTHNKVCWKKKRSGSVEEGVEEKLDLTALWDQSQYAEAFDINAFTQTLK